MSFDISTASISNKFLDLSEPSGATVSIDASKASSVLEYPAYSLVADTTNVTSQSYGNGVYTVSASTSSQTSYSAWSAFQPSDFWHSNNNYNATTGAYSGSTTTVDENGNTYAGDYLQIQLPDAMKLGSFFLLPRSTFETSRSPADFAVFGSSNGTNWKLLYTGTNVAGWTSTGKSFTVNTNSYFRYFRIVTSKVGETGNDRISVQIARWKLFGEPQTSVGKQAIIQDGLIAHFDPSNAASYPGSGNTLYNLVNTSTSNATITGTFTAFSDGTIRLQNNAGWDQNTSVIQIGTLTSIRTLSVWFYVHTAITSVSLLETPTSGNNSYINNGSISSQWTNGVLYRDGGVQETITWTNVVNSTGYWQNITVISTAPLTDVMGLFGRYTQLNNGMNCSFGPIMIYNRVITQAENAFNFKIFANKFGLLKESIPRSIPMSSVSTMAPSSIVEDGLIAFFDPAKLASYPGTGGSLFNLVDNSTATLGGTYNFTSGNIRLTNSSTTETLNTSYLKCASLSNVTSVSLWFYQHTNNGNLRYLIDGRTGGTGGWIYSAGVGSNWSSGTLYKNGGTGGSITWANTETLNVWQNVTVVANTPFSDDMNVFSGFDNVSGLDVTFGPILVYNRAITQEENQRNFNAFRSRFGLDGDLSANVIQRPLSLTTNNKDFFELQTDGTRALESFNTLSLPIATNGGFTITSNVKLNAVDTSATDGVYPPAALGGNSSTITGQKYGNGTYAVNWFSSADNSPWRGFDKANNSLASGEAGRFDYDGQYLGNNETFPPAAMTSDSTTFSGLAYGNTTYTALASSVDGANNAYLAFDKNDTTFWKSADLYNSTNGAYTGSASLYSTSGEWLRFESPINMSLKTVTITCKDPLNAPAAFRWATNTTLSGTVYTPSDWSVNPTQTFDVSVFQRFQLHVLVTSIRPGGTCVKIHEMYFTQKDPAITTDTSGVIHKGDFVQLTLPYSIFLKQFTLVPGSADRPYVFALFGSQDTSAFDLLYHTPYPLGLANLVSYTFQTNANRPHKHFRFVIKRISVPTGRQYKFAELSFTQNGFPHAPYTLFDAVSADKSQRVRWGQSLGYIDPLDYVYSEGAAPYVITETNANVLSFNPGDSAVFDRSQVSMSMAKKIVLLTTVGTETANIASSASVSLLQYQFIVPKTGLYNVQLEALMLQGNTDSIHYMLDGAFGGTLGSSTLRTFEMRTLYTSVTLSAGTHTLTLQGREPTGIGAIVVKSTDGLVSGYSVKNTNLFAAVHNGSAAFPRITSNALSAVTLNKLTNFALTYNDTSGDIKLYRDSQIIASDTSVNVYPPGPLTANSTSITAAHYGNGTYVASASALQSGNPFNAFDKQYHSTGTENISVPRYSHSSGEFLGGLSFPHTAMTSDSTVVTGTNYNTTYTASVSSVLTGSQAFHAFDYNTTTAWSCDAAKFDTSTGAYVGSASLGGFSGEWIQLSSAGVAAHSSITITPHQTNWQKSAPRSIRVLASTATDGTGAQLTTTYNLTWTSNAPQTIDLGLFQGNRSYRAVIVTSIGTNNDGVCEISELRFNVLDEITTDSANVVHRGHFAQLQLPTSIRLRSFDLRAFVVSTSAPVQFVMLGSTNGSVWDLLFSQSSDVTWTADGERKSFVVGSNVYYSYFRIVVKKCVASNLQSVSIGNLDLFGIEQISDKSFTRYTIGKSLDTSTFSNLSVSSTRVYPRCLTESELKQLTMSSSKPAITLSTTNVKNVKSNDLGLVALDARTLKLDDGVKVGEWNGFTQSTDANRPTYYSTGGYNNGPYVSFKSGASTFLDGGPRTVRPNSNGGLTFSVLARVPVQANFARYFDLANGSGNDNMMFSPNLNVHRFVVYNGASSVATMTTAGKQFDAGVWYVYTFRYRASDLRCQAFENNVLVGTSTASEAITDRSVSNSYIGRSGFSGYGSIDIAALRLYDRYLSDAEITSLYSEFIGQGISDTSATKIETGFKSTLDLGTAICAIDTRNFAPSTVAEVQEFPPLELTSDTTKIGNSTYAAGTYAASASSVNSPFSAYLAFETKTLYDNAPSFWHSADSGSTIYNATTGQYASTVTTIAQNGVSYQGEWLQIQLPSSIALTSFEILPRPFVGSTRLCAQRSPRNFALLGSNDGLSWTLVYTGTNVNNWTEASKTFSVTSSASAFTHFRLVVSAVGNDDVGSNQTSVQISRLRLFGVPKDADALAFPPAPLTANSTSLTLVDYGVGTYTASASTSSTGSAFTPFDNALVSGTKSYWSTNANFNATTGAYSASGTVWTSRTSVADNDWRGVAWSPTLRLFVAVAFTGTNRVMRSSDGISWTGVSGDTGDWSDVIWVPELSMFVAVAQGGTDYVMTSTDGSTWTTRTVPAMAWYRVRWSPQLRLLVAVAVSGTGGCVMTSPDGVTWTQRNSVDNTAAWRALEWSPELGMFVSLSAGGGLGQYSTNGTSWTQFSVSDLLWESIAWSSELGIFVASPAGSNVFATSTTGLSWTTRSAPVAHLGRSVIWIPEWRLFVAVSSTDNANVLTSPEGITWTVQNAVTIDWRCVTFSPELNTAVAVGITGNGNRVMTSGGPASGEYIQLQTPRAIALDRFTILPRQNSALASQTSPRYFTLQGSADGSTWTNVYTGTNVNDWTTSCKTFFAAGKYSYTYWRLLVTRVGNSGVSSGQETLQIAGIKLFEKSTKANTSSITPITAISDFSQSSPERAPKWISGLQEYPPATFSSPTLPNGTTASVSLTNVDYGHGTYTATASSSFNNSSAYGPGVAFGYAGYSAIGWHTLVRYDATTGAYTGAVSTTDDLGTVYAGEWLQIQLPQPIRLSYMKLRPRDGLFNRAPKNFVLLGFNGSTWTVLKTFTGIVWNHPMARVFSVDATSSFSSFRLVTTGVQNETTVQIVRWQLYGTSAPAFDSSVPRGFLSFNRTRSQHLVGGKRTINAATNGGLTCLALVRFNGDAGYYERVFDFGNGQANNNVLLARSITTGSTIFSLLNSGTVIGQPTSASVITQGTWLLLGGRYNSSSRLMEVFANGTRVASLTASTALTNKLTTANYIGRSAWSSDAYTNMDLAALYVFDRYLNNAEYQLLHNFVKFGNNVTLSKQLPTVVPKLAFPPRAMTGNTTTFSGLAYGNGTYVASASSEWNSTEKAYLAFEKTMTQWHSEVSRYSGYTYIGTVSTTDTLGNVYSGEWIQLQLAKPIVLSSFDIFPRSNLLSRNARDFVVLASNNGSSWKKVFGVAGVTDWAVNTKKTFDTVVADGYSFYRIVIQNVNNTDSVQIVEWTLYGYEASMTAPTFSGRYIRLAKQGSSNAITLPELEVTTSDGKSVSSKKAIVDRSAVGTVTSPMISSALPSRTYTPIQNGLIAHFDPNDGKSYPGSGATMYNLVDNSTATLSGTYSCANGVMRLTNNSSTNSANISRLLCQTLPNITTVSLWYYQHSTPTVRYLLDGRTGGGDAYIYSVGPQGTEWSSGTLYKNGGGAQSLTWNNIETVRVWQNVTVIANTPFTDDIVFFSRYAFPLEGLDVTFGPIFVYNRVLTQEENEYNYYAVLNNYFSRSVVSPVPEFQHVGKRNFPYPPAAVTGGTATISNEPYGNGVYVATASSSSVGGAYYTIDYTTGSVLTTATSANNAYNKTSGAYTGISAFYDAFGNLVSGEYLSLTLPEKVYPTGLQITPNVNTFGTSAPNAITLHGSTNNADYVQILSATAGPWLTSEPKTFNIGNFSPVSREYPPSAWIGTGGSTTLTSGSYGTGSYTVTTTTPFGGVNASRSGLFDKNVSNTFLFGGGRYDIDGNYLGNNEVYPPAPMTSDSTTFSGLATANGTYTSTTSSYSGTNGSFRAFDGDSTTYWETQELFDATTGSYLGSNSTRGRSGEWIQLTFPHSTWIKSFTITCNDPSSAPRSFALVDSSNSVFGVQTNVANWAENPTQTFLTGVTNTSASARNPWSLVVDRVGVSDSGTNQTRLQIKELSLTHIDPEFVTDSFTNIAHRGHWLKLQLPSPICLQSYTIPSAGPARCALLGSNDGANYSILQSHASDMVFSNSSCTTYVTSGNAAFNNYALVVTKGVSASPMAISDITFSGYPPQEAKGLDTAFDNYRLTINSIVASNDGVASISEVRILGGTAFGSEKLRSFPPVALASTSASVSVQAYGNGTYITSASQNSLTSHLAFNNAVSNYWTSSSAGSYGVTSGNYTGTTSMTAGAVGYAGEWLQLQTPGSIALDSIAISPRQDTFANNSPRMFHLFGSTGGSVWDNLTSYTTANNWTADTRYFPVNNASCYNYFRLLTNAVGNAGISTSMGTVGIAELKLFGKEITASPIQVTDPFAQIDLGGDYQIDKIRLYNDISTTANSFSALGSSLAVVNSNGNTVFSASVDSDLPVYDVINLSQPSVISGTQINVTQLFSAHNDIRIGLDAFYDGSWKPSGLATPFAVSKTQHEIRLETGSASTAGTMVAWTPRVSINSSGTVTFGSLGTGVKRVLRGSITVAEGAASSALTVTLPVTLSSAGYRVIVYPEISGGTTDTFPLTVSNKTTSSFDVYAYVQATPQAAFNVRWMVIEV